ncbi:MAG: VWA domain-containing protein [Thermoguttaceae bacterium]|nr:VWA domain-containing protein [Thermoguttaceae bacterium]
MTDLFAAATSFRFQTPLALLLVIPVLWQARRIVAPRRREAFLFSSLTVFGALPKTWASRLFPFVRALIPLGLILATVALARPQWGEQENRVESEGIAMAICLDRSGSMRNEDFVLGNQRVERFDAVKKIFHDFVLGDGKYSGRPNDKIALVVFGGYVDALCPLTLDHEALAEMLRTVRVPDPPVNRRGELIPDQLFQEESATAIGDALAAAVGRLKDADAKSKVIVLLSDGVQNVGEVTAEEAAELAKEFGIRIYTIGIGTRGSMFDPLDFDEETLRRVAEIADGEYYSAENTETLDRVCRQIDKLEKSQYKESVYTLYRELYTWFLFPGIVLILLGIVLRTTRFRSLP